MEWAETSRSASPLNFPADFASVTTPWMVEPSGTKIVPFTFTGEVTVASNVSPVWLAFELSSSAMRAEINVPVGTIVGGGGGGGSAGAAGGAATVAAAGGEVALLCSAPGAPGAGAACVGLGAAALELELGSLCLLHPLNKRQITTKSAETCAFRFTAHPFLRVNLVSRIVALQAKSQLSLQTG
jgi:hypothetical protein